MLLTRLNRSRRGAHGQRGFTLIELMISLLIMGLIMSVVYKVFSSQDRFFRNQEQISAMQENLRATMEYVNQELSWLGFQVPGIAVVKASPMDIIFKANIPNSGTTIQYVRYQFDPSINAIRRAAGAATTDVETVDLAVMASDMEALSFSYFNVLNAEVLTDTADPLCASEVPAAACVGGTPDDDGSLLMIQRVKARVTARTSRPDWMYTDPEGGANPNHRKRRAVLDLRARNIEDVTLLGGQIVPGACGWITHTITVPGGDYLACPDKVSQIANFRPELDFSDNPSFTISAFDMDGNTNTNAGRITYVYAVGDDGTPFNIYDSADPYSVDNTIDTGETRYVAAQELSGTYAGNNINLRFAYSDGNCTQTGYNGNQTVVVAQAAASRVYTTVSLPNGLSEDYIDNSGSPITLATPGYVAMCSSVGNERVLLGVQLNDDCANPIPGETIGWSDGGFGGSFVNETDNGDGTYSATYVPPDSMGAVAPVYTGTLSALWGSFSPNVDVNFVAAAAHDIVIDTITEVSASGLYQFVSNPQLDNASTFEIERVDGQLVEVMFHLVDECGNRVYGQSSSIAGSASLGALGATVSEDVNGNISVIWSSAEGCGAAAPGHITLSSSAIANPGTATETISFNLLETVSGPRVVMSVSAPGTLIAGNTSDIVTITAVIQEYNEILQLCTNVPGPFDVQYEVAGSVALRSGSFSGTDHEATVYNTTSAADGTATAELHPGTAHWNDALTVTATADVEGASYDNNIGVLLEPSEPGTASGFYDSAYLAVKGVDKPDRSYDPGDTIYVVLHDYDENETPLFQDSTVFPKVFVTLTSLRTGDTETVELTEKNTNTALFEGNIDSEINAAALAGDNILQVLYGDLITMDYEDKNDPAEFDSWTVFTSGPRSLELFKVVGAIETIIIPGASQELIYYEDNIRVKLYFPEYELDGSSGTTTDTIITGSGDDEDTLALRESGDSGILLPDYVPTTFTVTNTDTGDQTNWLSIPSTPRAVTVSYPDTVTPIETLTFTMHDQDLPTVFITTPTDMDTVVGSVLVTVNAADTFNTSASGGISRIELYINGNLYDSRVAADLSGDNDFTWTTTVGALPVLPTWLDGTHTLTARVWDTANNSAITGPVSVTLDNNLFPIEFTSPSYGSVWGSTTIPVGVQVSNLDTTALSYDVYLSVDGGPTSLMNDDGGWAYSATLDGTALAEGTRTLVATVRDSLGNLQWTALDLDVDRTPPTFQNLMPDPAGLDWISSMWGTPVWFNFEVKDLHGFADSSNPVLVTHSGPNGFVNQSPQWNSSWLDGAENVSSYWFTWTPPMAGYEGSITWIGNAWDSSNPGNMGSVAAVFNVDTILPTIDAPTVSPALGSLIWGTVDIETQVHDTFPQFVHLEVYNAITFTWEYDNGWVWDTWPILRNNVDGAGNFTYSWDTTTVADGAYVMRLGGFDTATNESPDWWMDEYIYFVDNSKPVVDPPYVYNPNNIVDGRVNVRYYTSDPFGIIEEVEVVIMQDGEHPSGFTPLTSELVSYPFDTRNTAVSGVASLDVSALSSGPYDVYCRATDFAGNQSSWSGIHNMDLDKTYLTALWGYYSLTGINFDVTVGGTLYDGAAPSVGSTIHLWARIKPASGDTSWQDTHFYVQTDAAGAYSSTPINNIQAGDLFYVYHYSPWNEFIGYNSETPPNPVFTDYTSYLPLGLQVRQPSMQWTEYPGPDYAADVGGVLWDNTGAVSGHNMRLRFNLYDSGGTYTGFQEYTATTAFDGSFSISTWPDLFPEGQRMYVYFYDDTIGGTSLGSYYGNAAPYIMPEPLRADDF